MVALASVVFLSAIGCGRRESRSPSAVAVPIDVLADSGRGERLHVGLSAPAAHVWLAHVSPARQPMAEPPLPSPSPEPVDVAAAAPPALQVDEGLKPPLLRHRGALRVPRAGGGGSVDLDVRVTEEGDVSDALWAGGTRDSARVEAAIRCAFGMRFFPALQGGRAVAVWCRQRFDFDAR